ncbi:G-protein coupled receptor 55-like [Megalops cyprinoides]|uniref:G-protein coupled receptor 55-like n=1 Tax=Megalops cyprinoides TaxID=118141 RepID=UPI001863D958|nr:G-protein coupled receptor 55-like [Megalops cyprinoides]
MNNCSFEDVDRLMTSLQLVIYIPIFVFGLILNTMALLVLCFVLRKWTESTIYMTNLALMDLLLLFPMPFKMHATKYHWNGDKRPFCSFLESLYFVSMYGSIYTIMCIAVDRYVAIKHPFRAKQLRSPRVARIMCVLIWVLVVGATAPVYRFHTENTAEFRCFHGFSDAGWNPALIVCLEVLGFLVPALVLVVCSVKIIRALQASQQDRATSQACIRIIYSNLCIFLVPFTPSHVGIFLQFLVRCGTITDCGTQTNISLFVQVAMSLANVTCCLDAFCYYFITREVRSVRGTIRQSLSHRRTNSTSEVCQAP